MNGYNNDNGDRRLDHGRSGQSGWNGYQDDQGRQEFFQRYNSVFQEPAGGYRGGYNGQSSQSSAYRPQAQPQVREYKKIVRPGKAWLAGVMMLCMVISMLGGAAGAYGVNYLSAKEGAVFYQAVTGNSSGSAADGGAAQPDGEENALPGGIQTDYTGSVLSSSEIAALAAPSVVEIRTEEVTQHNWLGQYIQSGAGSGVIFSEDGVIVTNDHVVEGATRITVTTKDGAEYDATLIGSDSKTDVAVIKIDATGLTPAILGDSDSLTVGEYAMAIGNPLGELGGTVTNGIISALSREISINGETMTLLQTNAAINPGNSGGGLFNERGELVGIVNAKSGSSGLSTSIEGLGFAIPINTVKNSVQELLDYGYVRGRAALGVTLLDIDNMQDAFTYRVSRLGVYVLGVTEGGASAAAGVEVGDCVIAIDDMAVESYADVKAQLNNHSVGDVVQMQVIRDGRTLTLQITLEEYKPSQE